MLLNTLKTVIIFLLNIIKRSLCCFRRRRKSSSDVVPLTDIGIIPNNQCKSQGEELQNWSTWDDADDKSYRPPQTIQEHIEYYRNSALRAQQQQEEHVQPDFFQDMEPTIKKPTQMFLKPKNTVPAASRLAFSPESSLPNDLAELKSWEESENKEGEWADSEWNTDEILRQKRKEEKKKKTIEREQKRLTVS